MNETEQETKSTKIVWTNEKRQWNEEDACACVYACDVDMLNIRAVSIIYWKWIRYDNANEYDFRR
jgi:hypothetical protein